MGFSGKAAPWQKGTGRGSDAKHHVPGGPHSSPSLPAQLGGGDVGSSLCPAHPAVSGDPLIQQVPAGQVLRFTLPLALACAVHTGWPAQGHRRFRKPPGGSAGREGRGEAKSRAAREGRCPRAEGGAFPVGREKAGPGLHVRAGERQADSFLRCPGAGRGWTDSRDPLRDSAAGHWMPQIPGTLSPTWDPQDPASRTSDLALGSRFPEQDLWPSGFPDPEPDC